MSTPPNPSRGEVWDICFDPSVGAEIQKTRPAVVVNIASVATPVANGGANNGLEGSIQWGSLVRSTASYINERIEQRVRSRRFPTKVRVCQSIS
jgi:PemK-like, MazF-like toxin of type II toxin-antitoxin system